MSDSSTLYTNLIQEAIKKKNDVTAQSVNQLELMYSRLAKELAREARKSKGFSKAWLNDFSKFIKFKAEQLYGMQFDIISGAIKEGARISASVQGDFYTYIGGKYDLDIPKELLDYAYSVNDDVLALSSSSATFSFSTFTFAGPKRPSSGRSMDFSTNAAT